MKINLHIPQWLGILMLILISITSTGYTYLGDQDGWKVPSTMSWSDQIMVWPTATAVQITHDRPSADLIAFIIWFVAQAAVLLCAYLAGNYLVSKPNPKGKDL
jgi:hypothetical protein